MKTIKPAREAVPKKNSQNYDAKDPLPLSVKVCIGTAERIDLLSQDHDQPPALITGALAGVGMALLSDDECSDLAGTGFDAIIMKIIRKDFPKQRIAVPIVLTEDDMREAKHWASNFNRPLDQWLSGMVEIGIEHYLKPQVLTRLIPSAEEAYFLSKGHRIREDADTENEELAALLRTAPRPASPFAKFERELAKGGAGD